VRSGITRQALRQHRGTLLAPASTQMLAAAVISAMVMTASSLDRAPLDAAGRRALANADIRDTTSVFIGVAIYLSILIVGVTMNLAMSGQRHDIALLRVIGASPGQVRRSVALQAAVVAVPASTIGYLLAVPAGAGWVAALKAHGVVPDAVRFQPTVVALPIALAVELATSVVGAWLASIRPARLAPAAALTESLAGTRPLGRARSGLGVLLVAAGAVLSAVLARFAPEQAADAAFFVMLAECVGVGLLGPLFLGRVTTALRLVLPDGRPRLALDDLATMTRSLSGALIPLVLAAAFAMVKVATHTTTAHVTGVADPSADLWTDYSGTAIYAAFAGVAALNCLVTVLVTRRGDLSTMQLVGASRRDLVVIFTAEAVMVAATAAVLAAAVATITLAPILHTSLHTWVPYLPASAVVGGLAAVGAVTGIGMVVSVALLSRRAPTAIVAAGP
jgi:putative ABC transport system permease protein